MNVTVMPCVVVCVFGLAGCGSGDSQTGAPGDDVANGQATIVVPDESCDRSTLDGLLGCLRNLREVHGDCVYSAYVDLVYPENDGQAALVTTFYGHAATSRCYHLMQLRVPHGEVYWTEGATDIKSAKILSNDGQRAIVELEGIDGEVLEYHMLFIDDQWWVSGYTYQYDKKMYIAQKC